MSARRRVWGADSVISKQQAPDGFSSERAQCAAHFAASSHVSLALVSFTIEKIGDRPAAELARDSALLEALKAVDRHLNLRTDQRLGSTDANIPLSLGIPAVSLGAGGEGGGAHTRGEWYSAANRELGLRRILLLTLAMLEWARGSR